jgi:hypothetical protein
VFFNEDPYRQNALDRISRVQQSNPTIEFVGIALPQLSNAYLPNPNPVANSVHLTSENNQPFRAPYLIHWDVNFNPVYYKIRWNEHLALRCGWVLPLNLVLNELI